MSQEFEKIVLEKLNTMDKKLDEHTDILKAHTETLNEHTRILNEHTETLNEHTVILNEHTETLNENTVILNEHTEQFEKVRKDIYQINNKIITSAQKMEDIEEVVEYNTQLIKKYNEENSKKIDISLKAYEQLNAKVKMNECMISNLKSKDFQNDIRITSLEDQVMTA